MYTFDRIPAGRFDIYRSFVSCGDSHKKRFAFGVTPANQKTINIYAGGQFLFTCGSFRQLLEGGSCTLDLMTNSFEDNEICTETVLSQTGVRYCVSAKDKLPFKKQKVDISAGKSIELAEQSLLFVLQGTLILGEVRLNAGAFAMTNPIGTVSGEGKCLVLV